MLSHIEQEPQKDQRADFHKQEISQSLRSPVEEPPKVFVLN